MGVTKEALEDLARTYKGRRATEAAAGLNLTVYQKSSGNRHQMFTSHLEQAVMLRNPETPLVFTGREKPYGQYTDSYKKTKNPVRIVDVISKFPTNPRWRYVYVVQDTITGVYDVIEVTHIEKLSEMHGYLRPTTDGDMWQPGMIIPGDTCIYRSNNHDEHENYRYGSNAKCCYLSIPETEEDGIVVSESFAKKITFSTVESTEIFLNINDVMLNLYGDESDFKAFPNLGEEVKNGILCGRRKIDYRNVASELTKESARHIFTNDNIFHGNGIVADIDIFVNDMEELTTGGRHRQQLLVYYTMIYNYWDRLKTTLGKIVGNGKTNSYTFALQSLFQRARDFLDKDLKYSASNGIFEFALITITTVNENSLDVGYKMTDRYGGKGVICKIQPDEMMPIDEYGERAEVILSPPGVVSRANVGQNYEHELNFIANHVRRKMRSTNNRDTKYSLLFRFLNNVYPPQAAAFKAYYESIPDMKKSMVLAEVEVKGIFIHQQPFDGNISYDSLKKLYAIWGVKPTKVRILREFRDSARERYLNKQRRDEQTFHIIPEYDMELSSVTPLSEMEHDEEDGDFAFDGIWQTPLGESGVAFEANFDPLVVNRKVPNKKTRTFINDNGILTREFVSQRPVVIAEKYIIVLKHIPEGKFSARSIGSTNPLGMPNKTSKTETGGAYSTTPIKFGEMELFNALIRVPSTAVHALIRGAATNPAKRTQIVEMLLREDPFKAHDIPETPIEDDVNDIPAKQVQVFLFCIGLEVIE